MTSSSRFESPYPGLRPFEFHEAPLFYGREKHVVGMLDILRRQHFLSVVGSSGCGKSSLVRAGLLPALNGRYLGERNADWRFVIMKPGGDPFGNLAQAIVGAFETPAAASSSAPIVADPDAVRYCAEELRRGPQSLLDVIDDFQTGPGTHVLVLADQFEEIFRYAHADRTIVAIDRQPDPGRQDDAAAFVDLLLSTAAHMHPRVYVALTMRSDFIGNCDVFRDLPEAINRSQFLPPRMTREELRDAIERPPQNADFDGPDTGSGLPSKSQVDADVVAELLAAMGDRQDQLPLIQHVLLRMWTLARPDNGGKPRRITRDHLNAAGHVAHALNFHASELYESLTSAQQRIGERLFRCLAERNASGLLIRRLTTVQEVADVAGVSPAEVIDVVQVYRQSGVHFLVTSPPGALRAASSIDISHESLLRQWKLAQDWVEDEVEAATGYQRLIAAVNDGEQTIDGLRLDRAIEWRSTVRPTPAWAMRYDGAMPAATGRLSQCLRLVDASIAAREERKRAVEHDRLEREEALAKARQLPLLQGLAEAERRKADIERKNAIRSRRMLWITGVVATLAIVGWAIAWRARAEAIRHGNEAVVLSAAAQVATRQAETSRLAAVQGLKQQLYAYTRATQAFAAIAAESTSKVDNVVEQRQVMNDILRKLLRGRQPVVVTGPIRDCMQDLVKRIDAWDPADQESIDELRISVLKLADQYRTAWQGEVELLPDEARRLFEALLARPAYERAIEVTDRLAAGSVNPADRDEFERLYWSELVLFETKEFEVAMVKFHDALDKERTDLASLATGVKLAAKSALSDLPQIDFANSTEIEPRSFETHLEKTAE